MSAYIDHHHTKQFSFFLMDDILRLYCDLFSVILPAAIDGNWGEWSAFSDCPVICGGGEITRTRSCDNPVPALGGDDCAGDNTDSEICNSLPCPSKYIAWRPTAVRDSDPKLTVLKSIKITKIQVFNTKNFQG